MMHYTKNIREAFANFSNDLNSLIQTDSLFEKLDYRMKGDEATRIKAFVVGLQILGAVCLTSGVFLGWKAFSRIGKNSGFMLLVTGIFFLVLGHDSAVIGRNLRESRSLVSFLEGKNCDNTILAQGLVSSAQAYFTKRS